MSLRQNLLLSIWIAGAVLGLSVSSIGAHESAQNAQHDPSNVTSHTQTTFNITDVSIEGDRLILQGQRANRKSPASLTIQIPNSQSSEEVKESREHFFDRVFNRDNAS